MTQRQSYQARPSPTMPPATDTLGIQMASIAGAVARSSSSSRGSCSTIFQCADVASGAVGQRWRLAKSRIRQLTDLVPRNFSRERVPFIE